MFEAMDGRVRAGPLGARSARKLRQHDVAETVVRAPGFGYFPRKESNPLALEASGTKTWMLQIATASTADTKEWH